MVVISQNPIDNVVIGAIAVVFLVFIVGKVIKKIVELGEKLGISQMFLGMTVLSIGTSLPEITTGAVGGFAILRGKMDPLIASGTIMGTSIGSDIVQQTFMFGLVGILAFVYLKKPIYVENKFIREDGSMLIAAAFLLLLFCIDGKLSRLEGAILFFGYILYLWFLWRSEDKEKYNHQKNKLDKKGIFIDILYITFGILIVALCAEYILKVSEFFVKNYNIGSSLIGVVIIGVASALPELTTSVTAVLRGAPSISVGTLIGSNITNPAFAIGLGAMMSSLQVPRPVLVYDIPVKLITSIIIVFFLWRNRMFTKNEAMAMIAIYFAYIFVRLRYFPVDM